MDKAFFPYGKKSKEFLIKRAFYLCLYLRFKVDKIILACNTLSLIALPFLRMFFSNVSGVFQDFIPYINKNSAIMGSNNTISILKNLYPNLLYIDGTKLINKIEKHIDYNEDIKLINETIKDKDNIILACTHFLELEDNLFVIKEVKNKNH